MEARQFAATKDGEWRVPLTTILASFNVTNSVTTVDATLTSRTFHIAQHTSAAFTATPSHGHMHALHSSSAVNLSALECLLDYHYHWRCGSVSINLLHCLTACKLLFQLHNAKIVPSRGGWNTKADRPLPHMIMDHDRYQQQPLDRWDRWRDRQEPKHRPTSQ